jgi:hypothetical protein
MNNAGIKTYHCILAIALGVISLYFWICVLFLKDRGIHPYNTETVKNLIFLAIILVETSRAKKIFKILNSILFLVGTIGCMFLTMFWPFGQFLFFVPAFAIILNLFADNFTRFPDRLVTNCILLFPMFHLVCIFITIKRLPGGSAFWLLDYIIMGIISLIIAIDLFKSHKKPGTANFSK